MRSLPFLVTAVVVALATSPSIAQPYKPPGLTAPPPPPMSTLAPTVVGALPTAPAGLALNETTTITIRGAHDAQQVVVTATGACTVANRVIPIVPAAGNPNDGTATVTVTGTQAGTCSLRFENPRHVQDDLNVSFPVVALPYFPLITYVKANVTQPALGAVMPLSLQDPQSMYFDMTFERWMSTDRIDVTTTGPCGFVGANEPATDTLTKAPATAAWGALGVESSGSYAGYGLVRMHLKFYKANDSDQCMIYVTQNKTPKISVGVIGRYKPGETPAAPPVAHNGPSMPKGTLSLGSPSPQRWGVASNAIWHATVVRQPVPTAALPATITVSGACSSDTKSVDLRNGSASFDVRVRHPGGNCNVTVNDGLDDALAMHVPVATLAADTSSHVVTYFDDNNLSGFTQLSQFFDLNVVRWAYTGPITATVRSGPCSIDGNSKASIASGPIFAGYGVARFGVLVTQLLMTDATCVFEASVAGATVPIPVVITYSKDTKYNAGRP